MFLDFEISFLKVHIRYTGLTHGHSKTLLQYSHLSVKKMLILIVI